MMEQADMIIQRELGNGEHLLWSGRPRGGIVFRSQDIFMIPFSILWGGFAILWEVLAFFGVATSAQKAPIVIIFPIFGIPFVVIGLYMIFGRFIVDRKQRERTTYGVTNERIIIISGLFRQNIKSLNLRTLSDLSISEKQDRSGTITFGGNNFFQSMFNFGGAWPGMVQGAVPSFEMIDDARTVYDIIRKAQS